MKQRALRALIHLLLVLGSVLAVLPAWTQATIDYSKPNKIETVKKDHYNFNFEGEGPEHGLPYFYQKR